MLTYDLACKISDHLLINNLGFCFLQSTGQLISREDCQKVIDEYNTIK